MKPLRPSRKTSLIVIDRKCPPQYASLRDRTGKVILTQGEEVGIIEKIVHLEHSEMNIIRNYIRAVQGRHVRVFCVTNMQKYSIVRVVTESDVYILEISSDTLSRAYIIRHSMTSGQCEHLGEFRIPRALLLGKRYRLGEHIMATPIKSIDILSE